MSDTGTDIAQGSNEDGVGVRRVSKAVVVLAIIVTAAGLFLGWAAASRRGMPLGGEMIGSMLGAIVFGLVIVLLFQVSKRFRNQHSRWKIYCWSVLLINLGSLSSLFTEIRPLVISS